MTESHTTLLVHDETLPTLDTVRRSKDFDDVIRTLGPIATGMHTFRELVQKFEHDPFSIHTARIAVRAGVGSEELSEFNGDPSMGLYMEGVSKAWRYFQESEV